MRARKTSVDIFIILLFWISQKYNFASPARNTQNWIQFEEHLVSYDDAVMHVAMLMDRCTKWSWCSPPSPLPKKKLMHPLWNPCRPQSLLCIPCPASFFVGLDQPWFEVASLVHPIWDVPALGPRRPLVYFLLPDYRNSDQICKSKCIFVMLMHSSLLATLSIKMGSSPSIHLLLLCYLHLWCYF